jgi:hypothetical protein
MEKRLAAALIGVLLLLVFPLACSHPIEKTKSDSKPCSPTVEPPVSGNASGALIVTDISGSMKGFAQRNSTRLFSLHEATERAVRDAVAKVESGASIKRCVLGNELDCKSSVPTQAMDNPATYSATESRLDLFMKMGGEGGAEQDPIAPYRIAVLLTDGMEAQQLDAKSSGPCMGGADPNCMAYLLKERAEKGYGIWIGLLLVPFKGTHFAERPLDDSQWQRIQQHVATLAQDPYFQGVPFSVNRAGAGTPFKSFSFQGVKPILVLALSRDKEVGRRFIEGFSSLARAGNIVQPANAVYTIELAPLSVKTRKVTKISLAANSSVEGVRPIGGKRDGEFFDYLLDCESKGNAVFTVNSEDGSGSQSVPDGVELTYNLVPAEKGSFPKNHLQVSNSGDKTYQVKMNCQNIKEGSYEAWLGVQADLKLDPNKPSFWNALSADNMYEAPERLYGLTYVVQTVLEQVIVQPRVTDCVRFRIERK